MGKPAQIIAKIGLDKIAERIANGEQQTAIAAELGIHPHILSWHVQKIPDLELIRESHHRVLLDEVDRWHDDAVAQRDFDLARAREAQAKRRYLRAGIESKAFAPRQELAVTHTHDLGDRLRRAKERTVTGERVNAPQLPHEDTQSVITVDNQQDAE